MRTKGFLLKVYGPYTRKDGRKHVVIKHDDNRLQTKSYPRYLLEQHLGRELTDEETVDHINNDFTDDRIDNLQILSREDNASKHRCNEDDKKCMSDRMKGRNNPKWGGGINTPNGWFETLAAAAVSHGISVGAISRRIRTLPDSYYYDPQ